MLFANELTTDNTKGQVGKSAGCIPPFMTCSDAQAQAVGPGPLCFNASSFHWLVTASVIRGFVITCLASIVSAIKICFAYLCITDLRLD